MSSLLLFKMDGEVEVDETHVGGKGKVKRGRAKGDKKLVVIGIQRSGKGISRAYARQIDNAGVKELKPFFQDHIAREAQIKTDGWRSYRSLKKKGWKIKQEKSDGGKNFDALHRFIICIRYSYLTTTTLSVT